MFRGFTTILLILSCSQLWGITQGANLLRACMNVNDSIVTILYTNPSDACGSFSRYHIYSKNTSSSYKHIATQTDFLATSIQIKMPNANGDWLFYFEALNSCDGIDSIRSNIIGIDSKRPALQRIDSVSVDLLTQKYIIGWSANSEPDTKGYQVYEYSKANDISSIIDDTIGLGFNQTKKDVTTTNWFTLAAFDSCNLFSQISEPHKPVLLHGVKDACTKSFNLSWSKYEGWKTLEHKVYKSLNGSAFVKEAGGINSTNYTIRAKSGDSVCAYISSVSEIAGITSSSNVVCVRFDSLKKPSLVYLSVASFNDSESIDIEVNVDNVSPTDSIVLYQSTGQSLNPIYEGPLVLGTQTIKANYSPTDYTQPEHFVARTFAPCFGATDTSNLGVTIYLELQSDNSLSWTPYSDWDGGVDRYVVMGSDDGSWNYIGTTNDHSYLLDELTYRCYRVQAIEKLNKYGFSQMSNSNSVCVQKEPTFYVPNALNSAGTNNTFKVVGTLLDYDKSSFSLFNRWGEIIFVSNQIDVGWNITSEGRDVPTGIYFYTLSIVDLSGNKHKSSGSFRIIR